MNLNPRRIIVFFDNLPRPDIYSGDRRLFGFLKILAKHHYVDFCLTKDLENLTKLDQLKYIENLRKINVNFILYSKFSVESLLAKSFYDIGIFEYFWMAEKYLETFRRFQPQAYIIVDSVDVHFVREEITAKLGIISESKANETKRRELEVYRNTDAVVTVSNADREILLNQNGIKSVYVVPNIVEIRPRSTQKRELEAIFIGGYGWHPNIDAVKWFVQEIWPKIHKEVPDAVFSIIGSMPTLEIKAMDKFEGVSVLGYVPETEPYLNRAAVSVTPLRYGGGMKGKVNEAMAHGVPVVTTSIGVQGINGISGKHFFVEDDPEGFANAVVKLLQDSHLQEKIGIAGQELSKDLCSPEVVEQKIRDIIETIEVSYISPILKRKQFLNNIWLLLLLVIRKIFIVLYRKSTNFLKKL